MKFEKRNSSAQGLTSEWNFRKLISLLLILAMVITYMPVSAGLSGIAYADSAVEVSSAEEFLAMDANGSYILTDDIRLSASYASEFKGTFDGNGHTITMGSSETSASGGAFATIGAGSMIKNLTVAGTISGTGNLAGIANVANGGTVYRCINTANISTTGNKNRGAGIVCNATGPSNDLRISECGNRGNITGFGSASYSSGVVAFITGAVTVEKCYNTGTMTAGSRTAGIVCQQGSSVAVSNCYNAGTIKSASNSGAILGFNNSTPGAEDCFYLVADGLEIQGGGTGTTTGCESVADADALLTKVSAAGFVADSSNINGGYPVFAWESSAPAPAVKKAKVVFTGIETGDELKLDGKALSATETALKAGTYAFTVKRIGYKLYSGSFTVTEAQAEEESTVTVAIDAEALLALTGITVSGYEAEYFVGDAAPNLTVTAVYSDSSTETVTGYTTDWDSSSESASRTVTVSFEGKTAVFQVAFQVKESLLSALAGKADVSLEAGTYGFTEDSVNGWLIANNKGISSSQAKMQITAKQAGELKFKYKISSEKNYDFLGIKLNGSNVTGWAKGNYSGTVDWTEYQVTLAPGDVLLLSYEKDSSGNSGDDTAYLKDFGWESVSEIAFTVTPSDAAIVLKSGSGAAINGTDGKYYVADGTYSYEVTAYGYAAEAGTIEVSGANVTKVVTLSPLPTQKATFRVTLPEGMSGAPAVTVQSGSRTLSAEADGSYLLIAGDYTYQITHPSCEDVTGSFTVTESDVTIEKTLEKKWTVQGYFDEKAVNVTAVNGTYGFVPDGTDANGLKSNNQGKSSSTAVLTLTMKQAGLLSFSYKIGSEPTYDVLYIKVNGADTEGWSKGTYSGVVDWKEWSQTVSAGDVVEFRYSKDSSGDKNEDTVWLKDFSLAAAYHVTFNGTPGSASVSLKDASGNSVAAKDGVYTVIDGTYAYEVSAFGYETVIGTVNVNGADVTVDLPAMTELEKAAISFALTCDNEASADAAEITLTHGTAGAMTAENGIYRVPTGETYQYEISLPNFVPVSGSITPSKDETIRVQLVYAGEAWDGTTKTEPQQVEGIYQISNAAELAWFADYVKNTDNTVSAVLTDNINLNGKTWASIGKYSSSTYANEYAGAFDGKGYSVTGLKGSGGLFDLIAADGSVKNVAVNCDISGTTNVGGLANQNRGVIDSCIVNGHVTGSGMYIGGIVGRCQDNGAVKNSVNTAEVKNTNTSYNTNLSTGGVCGYTYGLVENCYNTGNVSANETRTTNYNVAGLVGNANASSYSGYASSIRNCYSTGNVTGPADGTYDFIGTVASAATVTNCYVLNSVGGNATAGVEKKAAADMKKDAFVIALGNDSYHVDSEGINGGYPVLKWQGGTEAVDYDLQDVEAAKAALSIDTSDVKEAKTISLPTTGENDTVITWASDSETVISGAGAVTLPEEGITEVTLTATITKNNASTTKEFRIRVFSSQASANAELEEMKAKLEARRSFVLRSIGFEHVGYDNITEFVKDYLTESGYDMTGVTISCVDAGSKTMPATDSTVNLASDGTLSYFTGTGSNSDRMAIYSGVQIRLAKGGAEKTATIQANIGWDYDYVYSYLAETAKNIRWTDIFDESKHTATVISGDDDYKAEILSNYVDYDLRVPAYLGNVKVEWDVVYDDSLGNLAVVSDEKYDEETHQYYYEVKLTRPAYEDSEVGLVAILTFNLLQDGEDYYTTGDLDDNGNPEKYPYVYGARMFQFSLEVDEEASVENPEDVEKGLEDIYESLIRDFVEKTKPVDTDAVTADFQLPTPKTLVQAGVIKDRDVICEFTSADPDAIDFYGYHGMVYRPLPGEDPKTVEYTVAIKDIYTKKVIAVKTFTMTLVPFTQEELDQAQNEMFRVASNEVYWTGLKGDTENEIDNVSTNLKPFSEVEVKEDGSLEFIRGAGNIRFAGIQLDDLPGYDAMNSQPWREIRSSNETVITSEQLLVTRPEYDKKVGLDSVMTYTRYAQYWEKALEKAEAGDDSLKTKYAFFEQFYKIPVSVKVTVKGTVAETNPEGQVSEIAVTVGIRGGFDGFQAASGYSFKGDADVSWSAWDAVSQMFAAKGYTYTGNGAYIRSVTDPKGVTLEELQHGANSGWMFKVNGQFPDTTLAQTYLKNGDRIEMLYTGDYTGEPGVIIPGGGGTVTPGETPGEQEDETIQGGEAGEEHGTAMDDGSAVDKVKKQLAGVNADNFLARTRIVTMKDGKTAIKVTWKNNSGVKFDGVEIFRSEKRFSGYTRKPIFKTTKKAYYNTAITPGTRYYYKVRGYIKVNGKKYYSDWSSKAWRKTE